ncbi:MAG: hypothetical protein ABSF61_13105 [Anaerolineales bacterium]
MKPPRTDPLDFSGRYGIASLQSGIVFRLAACRASCGSLREPPSSPPSDFLLPSLHVTADQVASAVQEDRFFSDRGVSTRLVQGTVVSVGERDHDLLAELGTSVPTRIFRDLRNPLPRIQVSDTLKVQSAHPQMDVSRQASGLMIRNCRISPWKTWRIWLTRAVSPLPAHP